MTQFNLIISLRIEFHVSSDIFAFSSLNFLKLKSSLLVQRKSKLVRCLENYSLFGEKVIMLYFQFTCL